MGRGGEAQASGSPPEVRSHAIRVNPRFVLKDPRRVSALSRHRRASLVPSHPRPEDTYYPPHARGNFPNPSIGTLSHPRLTPSSPINTVGRHRRGRRRRGRLPRLRPRQRGPQRPPPRARSLRTRPHRRRTSTTRRLPQAQRTRPGALRGQDRRAEGVRLRHVQGRRRGARGVPARGARRRRSGPIGEFLFIHRIGN